jgi:succinate dehydrogenase / fumarate reductase membrane anchor subunit
VVIEDYVHTEWLKIASITTVKLAAIALAVAGVYSVIQIAFGG